MSLSSQKYELGIRDPGSRDQKGTGSRIQRSKRHQIPDPDPQHCIHVFEVIPYHANRF
jgi:hypothetical protein